MKPSNLLFKFNLLLIGIWMSACEEKISADLIVVNGQIQSAAQGKWQPYQEAAAFKDGRVLSLGSSAALRESFESENTKLIDLNGAFVYPGFIDAHAHFSWLTDNFGKLPLHHCRTVEQVLHELAAFKIENPDLTWLTAYGWQGIEEADLPKLKNTLDNIYANMPVVLYRVDEHAAVVNSKAMQLAGIDTLSHINGGTIDHATGLVTDNALTPVRMKVPKASFSLKNKWAKKAADSCFRSGLTAVSDSWLEYPDLLFLKQLNENPDWSLFIFGKMAPSTENEVHFFSKGPQKIGHLYLNCLKIFADGALGSRGALLKTPYEDSPQHYGSALTDSTAFDSILKFANQYQLQVATHCIGDAAVEMTLKHYQKFNPKGKRWRIEHLQLLDDVDLEQLAAMEIIPSVQPVHATGDLPWLADRIGLDRIKQKAYRNADLLAKCGLLAYGSDFPIEPLNPLEGFYNAVFRKPIPEKINGNERLFQSAFWQKQKLDPEAALLSMTYWAAAANFAEKEMGSLESGKYANFVVLNQDLKAMSEDFSAEVLATFIKGEAVYAGKDFDR